MAETPTQMRNRMRAEKRFDPGPQYQKTNFAEAFRPRLGGAVARMDSSAEIQGPSMAGAPVGTRISLADTAAKAPAGATSFASVSDSAPQPPKLFGQISDEGADGLSATNFAQRITRYGKQANGWEAPGLLGAMAIGQKYAPSSKLMQPQSRYALGGKRNSNLPY